MRSDSGPPSFRDYVSAGNRRYVWYDHCRLLAETLERVTDGEIRRLVVNMPPQHGKSELVSRSFPGYHLLRNPHENLILTSYGADLAYALSRDARDRFVSVGGHLRPGVRAVKDWRTRDGGGLRAAGVKGSLTGHPADGIIIDDPYKDDTEASSPRHQEQMAAWYDAVITTRLAERGFLIIMCTRWDPRDLVGLVMSREESATPEGWHVLSLPAITDGEPQDWPASITEIPDFRTEPDVALCEGIRSLDYLRGVHSRIDPYFWNSIWQQRPRDPAGSLFRREVLDAVQIVDRGDIHPQAKYVRAWDRAATEGAGDWTVGVLMATHEGTYWVVDVVRGQWSDLDVMRIIVETAELDDAISKGGAYGPRPEIVIEREPGGSGKAVAAMTLRSLAGYPAFTIKPIDNKTERARPLATYLHSGAVRFVQGKWNRAFRQELLDYRNADSQSDQVDAAAYAFTHLALRAGDPLFPHREEASR